MTPDDARREAERRFGTMDEARSRLHDSAARREARMRFNEWLQGVRQGLTVTLRGMRRSPGFVAIAVACIALGVGANAAAYSMFDELVLRPLPVRDPERLARLESPGPKGGSDECNQAGGCDEVFSYPMFRDLQRSANTGFASLAAHRLFIASVASDQGAAQGDGNFVSGSYFPTLGIAPALGRLLGPADDEAPGANPVAVVSHHYWSTHLGADPNAVGRTLTVNGRRLTIVGVTPRGFEGTTLGTRLWLYVPLTMAADVDPFFGPRSDYENRSRYWAYVFGRLAPGTTRERAQAAATTVYRGILASVEQPLHGDMSKPTMARFLAKEILVEDGRHGQSSLRGSTRTPLLLLLGITGLVVLISCANIANLLLVRGAGRATEIAVRMSLGAGRRQLVAQLLTESVVLAILGGVASVAVAWATLRLIGSFIPAAAVGFGVSLSLELRPSVLMFAGGVALLTGLLFGLFPAMHATRSDLIAAIRSGAGQIAGGHRAAARFRTTLVTAQIALSMALLGCAGLFVRSLRNVSQVELGVDAGRVVQFALLPQFNGYDARRAHATLTRVEDDVAALPGIEAVSVAGIPLFTGSTSGGNVYVEGKDRDPDAERNVRMNMIGAGFFRALDIPLVTGREFTAADRLGTPKVAIVNESFVRKFSLGRSAVGTRMRFGGGPEDPLDTEIVGVVRDASYNGVKEALPPMYYRPFRQDSTVTAAAFYARTSLPPEQAMRLIPPVVARVDRNLPVPMLKPL
jgi:predicted permease